MKKRMEEKQRKAALGKMCIICLGNNGKQILTGV